MKLTKGKTKKDSKFHKIYHNKNASQEINNYSTSQNYFITKFINNNNIKTTNEILKKENLPNLKINIQNIFSNDDKKQRAIQYLMKIRKERNSSPSTDFKKILPSEYSKDKKILVKNEKEISPYNSKDLKKNHHENKSYINSYIQSQKKFDINLSNDDELNIEITDIQNSGRINNFIFEEKDLNQNNIYNYSHYLENNNNYKKRPLPKNNNMYNNYNLNNNKKKVNNPNKTFDNYNSKNNPINITEDINNSLINNKFVYSNYMKNYNISTIKKKLLNTQKNDNHNKSQIINIDNNSFYIHKKPIYAKFNLKNGYTDRDNSNSNIIIKEIGNNKNYLILEKDKFNYKLNKYKDNINSAEKQNNIYINQNKNDNIKIKEFNKNELHKINLIQLNFPTKKEDKNIISFSKYKKNQKKNKDNNYLKFNKDKVNISNQIGFTIFNVNQNKFKFNNEEEIIEYIENKYNTQIITINKSRKVNNTKEKEFKNIEEEKLIKEKNEMLLNEINKLKYENKQYKKELIDIRNQFNELSNEKKLLKEENEKLKDNIINNMINDDEEND